MWLWCHPRCVFVSSFHKMEPLQNQKPIGHVKCCYLYNKFGLSKHPLVECSPLNYHETVLKLFGWKKEKNSFLKIDIQDEGLHCKCDFPVIVPFEQSRSGSSCQRLNSAVKRISITPIWTIELGLLYKRRYYHLRWSEQFRVLKLSLIETRNYNDAISIYWVIVARLLNSKGNV